LEYESQAKEKELKIINEQKQILQGQLEMETEAHKHDVRQTKLIHEKELLLRSAWPKSKESKS